MQSTPMRNSRSGLVSALDGFKEDIVRQVDGSMAIEGMALTKEDKERIRNYAFDESQIDAVVANLVKKHSGHEPER